jgi:hypothetical protein
VRFPLSPPGETESAQSRRELGSVYTPPPIAHGMVRTCVDRWYQTAETESANGQPVGCRVLDPACGDGAFVLEVFDELCRRRCDSVLQISNRKAVTAFRLGIVRDQIFGVDIDPVAVEALRDRLLERIAPTAALAAEADEVVAQNIRCGNSLTGPGWKRCQEPILASSAQKVPDTSFTVDWERDFPAAAAAGGFDIIVGNPPYLRERNAKALFDSLATTHLGRQWREARMDLWYYFVHRSLDLLRPGGILSFIVNSYWMSSRGAAKLIARLERDAFLEQIELLGNAPVFKAVAGRHMIFRLRKRDASCSRRSPADSNGDAACRIVISKPLPMPRPRNADHESAAGPQDYRIPLADLFQNGRLVVAPADPHERVFRRLSPLGEAYPTRQGMAENPPVINRRLQREFPDRFALGEGVFVLRTDEIEHLSLAPAERQLLRPYYETSAVGRYRIAAQPTHAVLYLTRRTAPRLDEFPKVAAHLERFRPILERRRETREGKCGWWHLHWPREEAIFIQPRILCVQMGRRPQFVFVEQPTYVGFSINVILPGTTSSFLLEVLTGILNSSLARSWFERHAKRRGVNLEINAHVLRAFPLPERGTSIELRIEELVRARHSMSGDDTRADTLEQEIEESVERLYRHGSHTPG